MIKRALFVPPEYRNRANLDEALQMPSGDFSISQASLVGQMLELLDPKPTDRVLEVGGGTGYHAACLSERCSTVVSVELLPHAAKAARISLREAGIKNVEIREGDGFLGGTEGEAFEHISVACAVPGFPAKLFQQLRVGGKLLYPASIPGTEAGSYPDILLRITKLHEVDENAELPKLRASMSIEQCGAVFFMRGRSPHLTIAQETQEYQTDYGRVRVFDVQALRPEVGFFEIEHTQGGGPPLHYHTREDEGFFVKEGEFRFRVGDSVRTLSKGGFATAKQNEAHKYRASGTGTNTMIFAITPGGGQRYFAEMAALTQSVGNDVARFQKLTQRYGQVLLESSANARNDDKW